MAGPDMSVLMAAVDFDGVVSALMAVCTALVSVYVIHGGCRAILRAVRGDDLGAPSIGISAASESEYRSMWDSMTDDDKSFYGAWTYEEWRQKYTVE